MKKHLIYYIKIVFILMKKCAIINEIYKELVKLRKAFKYSSTVLLQKKHEENYNFACAMHVDNKADGQVTYFYTGNKYYDVVVSVAGFRLEQKN